jgi:hypothetical protein
MLVNVPVIPCKRDAFAVQNPVPDHGDIQDKADKIDDAQAPFL